MKLEEEQEEIAITIPSDTSGPASISPPAAAAAALAQNTLDEPIQETIVSITYSCVDHPPDRLLSR